MSREPDPPVQHSGATESSRPGPGLIVVAMAVLAAVYFCEAAAERDRAGGSSKGGVATTAGISPAWWSTVRKEISAEEYRVTWQDRTFLEDIASAWHAPNRAHGFRTYFTDDGIRVIPRTEEAPSWEWGLSLVGYGRGGTLWPASGARLSPIENRIDYDRGGIVEWYVNDPRGLEQGFTLVERPENQGAGPAARTVRPAGPGSKLLPEGEREGAVYVQLALTGSLNPAFSTDGQAIDFQTGRGVNVVHLAALKVVDAGGRELPSWMEGFAEAGVRGIRIVFDGADAEYPVTIDPLATGPAWTAESNQDGARFGSSVSTAGDVNGDGYSDVIVGAEFYDNGLPDEGRAFVYYGSAAGLAANYAWTAAGGQAYARFGHSVSTAGDVDGDGYADLIVGADYFDSGQADEGRAYVYHGSEAGLAGAPAWIAESDQPGAQFGVPVSTAGDVNGDGYADVIVGACSYDNDQIDEGRVYVYHGSDQGLDETPAWTAEGNQEGAAYGCSASTAGDVNGDGYADVVVGAYLLDNGAADEGGVYVYRGSGAGLSAAPDWTAEGGQAGANFGVSVSTAGDVDGNGYADITIGAYHFDNGETDEGRAYLYHGSDQGLDESPAWTAESDQAGAEFGRSVSTAGDVNGDGYADLIVGARRADNIEENEGRAYVYHGSSTGLAATPAWTVESNQANAYFAHSVSTAGDVNGDGYADVVVGAYAHDNGQTDEGRAYAYHGSAGGLAATAGWTSESGQAGAEFGFSASTAGDINGDGYADVIVGADRFDNGHTDEGAAFVYHGSAAGLSTAAAWTAESDQADARFGGAVATAGDVNGDGYADVVVGAPLFDNGETDEGQVYVYRGSAAGLSAAPAWTAEGDQARAGFGVSVSTAGDVDGDGYADVVVGAPDFDNGQADEGRAYVYRGSAGGLGATPAWTAEGDQVGAGFGVSVSTAGDVNGDRYSDVIVGADRFDDGQTDEGRAYVYHGSEAGLSAAPAWTAESDQASAGFGVSVSTAGDVNGDGYSDAIVGAECFDNGQEDEGRAYVYHGAAAGLAGAPAWIAESDQPGARFGSSVSTAGDVNGDGNADVIVGACSYDNVETDEGRAYVYLGSKAGLASGPAWTAEPDQAGTLFGCSVAPAGDVNGDGYGDVIVGTPWHDGYETDEGGAFVYYGNDGPGLSLRPEQRRVDDAAPIAALGASDSPASFRLKLLGRTPFGRGKVKLEWEVKLLGSPLDGSGAKTGPEDHDTGANGVDLSELETGLVDEAAYHWRVRMRYDPVTTPYAQRSRWLAIPWKGWQETALRTGGGRRVLFTEPRPTFFDGQRRDPIAWTPPQPLTTWSIVAVVRPTAASASGSGKIVVTNDSGDSNDDLLFGIIPEGAWAVIHRDDPNTPTEAVVPDQSIEADTWYHIAATSDGEHLRFYVNGLPATCPVQKKAEVDLIFGDSPLYIGGGTTGEESYFQGDIAYVAIYDARLDDDDIEALAALEGLLDGTTPSVRCRVDGRINGTLLNCMTSVDFVNGDEVITEIGPPRFHHRTYRPTEAITWRVAATLSAALKGQHSITWSDSVTPPRYFVADTDNHRIVSFESLAESVVYSDANTIASTPLARPHDLAYNPVDGFFYGVTAPFGTACVNPKILFRFRDIDADGMVVDPGVLAMADPNTDCNAFYMRSLSVVDGVVYVVNSRFRQPQVFRIDDFVTGDTTTYTADANSPLDPDWTANLQAVELHNGWWYGTGSNADQYGPARPLLARWKTWADFEGGSWEDLSDRVYLYPDDTDVEATAYFLTRWNGKLFFSVYHNHADHESRIYEIVDCAYPAEAGSDLRFISATDLIWTGSEPDYSLYRGTLSLAGWQFDHVCLQANLPLPSATDPEEPGVGSGFYYLVSGVNECGEGSLGTTSAGGPRPPCQSCP